MSTQPDDQADRLARLAQRRGPTTKPAGSRSPATASPASTDAAPGTTIDRHTNIVLTSPKRHGAATKVVSTGIATSGFFAAIGSLAVDAQHDQALNAAQAALTLDADAVVVQAANKVVYVDEFGNPVAPPVSTDPTAAAGPPAAFVASAASWASGSGALGGVPDAMVEAAAAAALPIEPLATAPAAQQAAGTPAAAAPKPAAGGGGAPAAAPAAAPAPAPAAAAPAASAPAALAAPAPPPAAAPAPPPAAAPAPAPPPTAAPAPPPPPPPTTASPQG